MSCLFIFSPCVTNNCSYSSHIFYMLVHTQAHTHMSTQQKCVCASVIVDTFMHHVQIKCHVLIHTEMSVTHIGQSKHVLE